MDYSGEPRGRSRGSPVSYSQSHVLIRLLHQFILNQTPMTIRPMKIEDAQRVAELSTQLGHPNTAEDIRSRFAKIEPLDTHAFLVAVSPKNEVCGFIQVNIEAPKLISSPRAEIAALVVDEEWRGRGVGSQLVSAAETWARSKNIPLIRLTSNVLREDAHRFYKREGYEILKTWHLFTKSVCEAQ